MAAGLLLAAGKGVRFGGPKATARTGNRSFLEIAVEALVDGGCAPVHVVVGDSTTPVPPTVVPIFATLGERGLGESLRAGLLSLADVDAASVLIHLVDLPDVGASVVARVGEFESETVLARATYRGRPGHPVVVGRRWWAQLRSELRGDSGARDFLRDRARAVECGDLATGRDVDTLADLSRIAGQHNE